MTSNITDPVRDSQEIPYQLQLIEEQLQTTTLITPDTRSSLHHELDDTWAKVSDLRERAQAVNVFVQAEISRNLEGSEERMISLYGRIDNQWIDFEITAIGEDAGSLHGAIDQKDRREVALKAEALKKRLHWFRENVQPLQKDRKILFSAYQIIKQAEAFLERKPLINQWNLLSLQVDRDPWEATELYEIANLFHSQRTDQAMRQYRQLESYPKSRVEAHLDILKGRLNDPQDNFKTAQALIATAHEISDSFDGTVYKSPKELDQIFANASKFTGSVEK